MECYICKEIKQPTKENKTPCIPCDVCRRIICSECTDLSPTEIRCVTLQKRILQYKCKHCRYEVVEILQNTIKDKDKIIELLQEKINKLEQHKIVQQTNTFAEVVKTQQLSHETGITKRNIPKIIIKPRNQQNVSEIKTDIENINLAEIKVGIKNIQIKDSGIVTIKCLNECQTNKLMETTREKYNEKYDIKLTKMRNPKIKIPNFRQNMNVDDIQKSIENQNDTNGIVKVTYIKTNKNGSKTIYCECCSSSFKTIMETGKINIGWERYSIYEDLSVLRCFKCQAYHHKMNDCKNAVVCPSCSENHEQDKCKSNKKCCYNCKFANNKYGKNYNTEHSPGDPSCSSLLYQIEVLKSYTNY